MGWLIFLLVVIGLVWLFCQLDPDTQGLMLGLGGWFGVMLVGVLISCLPYIVIIFVSVFLLKGCGII